MEISRINTIQNRNTNFKMKISTSEPVKYAVWTARDLMGPLYKEQNRDFVQEFCNGLVRILKSKQADRIWPEISGPNNYDRVGSPFVEEIYKSGKSKRVLWLDGIQEKEHRYGSMIYSQEGGNMMRTLIEYSKMIKDVPKQKLNLTDEQLKHYAYSVLGKDLHSSTWGFEYPEAGRVKFRNISDDIS